MTRTFVIGDIHGAFKALQDIIQKIEPQKDDRLIFLGDYVDGWSQSFEVMELLMELNEQCSCIFIKGNHDAWCEDWLKTGAMDNLWYTSGGEATIKSYENKSPVELMKHVSFLEQMQNYFVDEHNRLFIHAGFAAVRGPENERYKTSYWWDRTLWETALAMDPSITKDDVRYPKRLKLFTEIYIGHTPTIHINKYEPVNAINVWNMDTGAAFNGKLSVMNVDTKEFWQSDTVQLLYPGEAGRNN